MENDPLPLLPKPAQGHYLRRLQAHTPPRRMSKVRQIDATTETTETTETTTPRERKTKMLRKDFKRETRKYRATRIIIIREGVAVLLLLAFIAAIMYLGYWAGGL